MRIADCGFQGRAQPFDLSTLRPADLATHLPARAVWSDRAGQAAQVLAGALLLVASARAVLPVPGTPVPVTAQTLAVLLLGAMLGPVRGPGSVATYLLAGAAGAPVFAAGGGAPYLLGPTGGYLLGFLPAAWLTGALFERGWGRRPGTMLPALLLGDAVLFAFGLAWLGLCKPLAALPAAGLLPFLPGEAVKIALAAVVLQRTGRR